LLVSFKFIILCTDMDGEDFPVLRVRVSVTELKYVVL